MFLDTDTKYTNDSHGKFFEPCVQRLDDYSTEFSDDCKNISLNLFKDHMPKTSENLLLDREVEEDGQHIKFCCNLCSEAFENPDALETHFICHNTLTLTCECCGSQFENAIAFQQHTEIHKGNVGELKVECDVSETLCAEDCKSTPCVAVNSCRDDEKLFCSLCDVAFDNEAQFESHQEEFHSTEQLLVCFQCKRSFAEKSQLKKHLVGHESNKNFVCEVCNRSFSQEYYLKKHQRTHSSSLDYICPSCGKQFKLLEYLKAHMKSHCSSNNDSSGDNSQKMHHCAVCNQAFSHRCYLKSHAKIHAVEKPYQCKTCGKRVKVKCIQQHMETHSTERERPYGCDKCSRRFTRHADLQAHLQTHSGTKSHCCPICARGFHKKCDVQRHIRIHTGERPYVCETCGKSFKILFHLRLHSYVHSTDRPHQCNSCGKTFSSALRLKKHEFIHSGICPYACPICSRRFNRQANMRSHMKTHSQKSQKSLDPVAESGFDVVYETAGNNLEEVQASSDNLEMVFYKFEKPEVFVALPLDSLQSFKL